MRACREDTSTTRRLKPRKRITARLFGRAVRIAGWAAVLGFATPMVVDSDNPDAASALRVGSVLRAAERAHAFAEAPSSSQSSGAQLNWSDAKPPAASAPRQTSFNDDNYRPRSDVNVVPPPAEQYWHGGAPRYVQAEPVVRHERWEWPGADRKPQRGRFEWVEQNGAITYASVCRNYQRGSILYRDCRKGAKRAFAQMCSKYKPACHAANNFMP